MNRGRADREAEAPSDRSPRRRREPAAENLHGIYRLFVRYALRPWLRSADRDEVLRDIAELRADRRARQGRTGLARYTWRQLIGYPALLARERQPARPIPARKEATMDSFFYDLRLAGRTLRRTPLLTLTVVGILGLAISANTAIFSVVHAVLIEALPFPAPDRVVALWTTTDEGARLRLAPGTLVDSREIEPIESLGAFMGNSATLDLDEGEPEVLQGTRVTTGYFEALGVAPLLGRIFEPHHFEQGEPPVVILGHDVWARRFQSDTGIVGRQVFFGETGFEVLGVMPPGLYPTEATIEATMPLRSGAPDFWVPIRFAGEFYGNRTTRILGVIGRLSPDVTLEETAAAVQARAAVLGEQGLLPEGWGLELTSFRSEVVGSVQRALTFLLLTVGAVLLIAASNVAALLLTRAESRQGELAVRAALGAGRWRLVRLQLMETFVLAAAGGALGIATSSRLLDLVRGALPTEIPRIEAAGAGPTVLAFTVAVVAAVTVVSGLIPALFATRPGLLRALRQVSATRTADSGRRRLQSTLVVAQTALAVVLLVASALLVRSFIELGSVDLGYDQNHVLVARLDAPDSVDSDPVATLAFWGALQQTLAEVPGVGAVGLGSDRPVERRWLDGFRIEGEPDLDEQGHQASLRSIGPGYLEALRVPVLLGRGVTLDDRAETAPVAFINEAAARAYFGGVDPIGQRITIPSLERIEFGMEVAATREVVGVIGDIRHLGPTAEADPSIYLPLQQFPSYSPIAVIREEPNRSDVAAAVQQTLRGIDRGLAVRGIDRLPLLVGDFTTRERFATVLVSSFGSLGLLLSTMGLYALVSRLVAYRTREYGLRLAIGAPAAALLRDVFGSALRPVGLGVLLGLAAAAPVTLAMRSQLFAVTPLDPVSYAAAPLILLVVALLAAMLCARRALRVDPADALRADG